MDFDLVQTKLLRGAYVGAGSFASSFAGNIMSRHLPFGDMGVSGGKVALGVGVSIGAEEVIGETDSIPNEAAEFAGYGIQGAGFAELANTLQTGANTGRTVSVQSRKTGSDTSSDSDEEEAATAAYRLDTA